MILSLPTGSRAVHRGLFIAQNYLCRVMAPPPTNLQAEITKTVALGLNERELAELRASKASCAGCHSSFDGIDLAFEHYDLVGTFLTERDGAAVNAHGELHHSDADGSFANLLELSELLARSRDVALCLPQPGRVHEITHQSYLNKHLDLRLITNWYGERCSPSSCSTSPLLRTWTAPARSTTP
jgi:hypothetical protein